MTSVPLGNPNIQFVNDLKLTYATSSSLTVGIGKTQNSTNEVYIPLQTQATLDATLNGLNGLDTGSLGNSTWYYVFVIGSTTAYPPTTFGVILSTSATAPTLPFNYDLIKRIGCARTNGSAAILSFYCYGNSETRTYKWNIELAAATVLSSGAATTYTGLSLAALVPPTANQVLLKITYVPQSAGDKFYLRPTGSGLTELDSYSMTSGQILINTNDAQSIDYKVTGTGALTIQVLQFIEYI